MNLSRRFPIVVRRVSEQPRPFRFEYRSQRKFIASRIGIIRLLREPFTPAPILLINRKVRMNSLENPDPQFLESGDSSTSALTLHLRFVIHH